MAALVPGRPMDRRWLTTTGRHWWPAMEKTRPSPATWADPASGGRDLQRRPSPTAQSIDETALPLNQRGRAVSLVPHRCGNQWLQNSRPAAEYGFWPRSSRGVAWVQAIRTNPRFKSLFERLRAAAVGMPANPRRKHAAIRVSVLCRFAAHRWLVSFGFGSGSPALQAIRRGCLQPRGDVQLKSANRRKRNCKRNALGVTPDGRLVRKSRRTFSRAF